jgi:hypothetical protein
MSRPLQNRVDPFGVIHAVAARGTWMGNRGGCLHNDRCELTRRRWVSKRWIACVLVFKERHRTVMTPRRYTELFFLDEATALAAGHRPCFECRREAAQAFAAAWGRAADCPRPPSADEMDRVLHGERRLSRGSRSDSPVVRPADLPNGVMVALPSQEGGQSAWLVRDGALYPWSFTGYGPGRSVVDVPEAALITPPSMVAAIRAGYSVDLPLSAPAS